VIDQPSNVQAVIVTGIRMPFWSIVAFLVKLAIAAIPALIILTVISFIIFAVSGWFFVGYLAHLARAILGAHLWGN
jgi:hypothetical protein